jgi:hypothetical protein
MVKDDSGKISLICRSYKILDKYSGPCLLRALPSKNVLK